jgi:hypothetical protein
MISNPKKATFITSVTLISISIIGYLITCAPTALIPSAFGILMLLCYYFYDKNNKLFAHIILALLILVFIALFTPLNKRIDASDMWGIFRVSMMQLVSLYSIICFIYSFIEARKK